MQARRLILGSVLVWGTFHAPGCAEPLSPRARHLLRDGHAAYRRGDDVLAAGRMGAFLRDHSRSRFVAEAYYIRGLARYRLKDLPGAEADLEAALKSTDRKDLSAKAQASLGHLAYDTGRMNLAEDRYRKALSSLKTHTKASGQVHYRLGCALQRQGRWQDADMEFDRVTYVFPGTNLAERASRRVRCDGWGLQAGSFREIRGARKKAAQLRARQLPALTRPALRDGRATFLVLVGPYETYQHAKDALGKVKRLARDAFVTTIRRGTTD